ncbi:MAG: hypothetical protein MT490_14735 [Sphingomonas sp.]|uniref:hypothetical protein n=1 Tax=Sphingomonas sp. TaxID=28214 RepID=UPI0022731B47|nr:hypothetical protein [Sphingomonas sp.]MCX8477045.1 hypothetical protein [Sphingomonas sp.]
MPKSSSRHALLLGLSLACVAALPAVAQDAPVADQQVTQPADAAAIDPCQAPKKKKKKGLGLGGLFKAARSSGLTNLAGMGGLGKGGALANAAIGTAASLGEAAAAKEAAKPVEGGC